MLALVGVTLAGMVAAAVLIVMLLVDSDDSASNDPHGYVGIFGVVGLVVLLLPTMLLFSAVTDLRRRKKAGFVWGPPAVPSSRSCPPCCRDRSHSACWSSDSPSSVPASSAD